MTFCLAGLCTSHVTTIFSGKLDRMGPKQDPNKTATCTPWSECNLSVQYIAEAGANLMASRVFWLVMVITAASFGIHWSREVSDLGQV